MSWDHRTVGDAYNTALTLLEQLDIHYVELYREWRTGHSIWEDGRRIRKAAFVHPRTGQHMLLEEYVGVRDYDCDGVTQLAIEVYPVGHRPDIESRTQVLEA